MTVTVRRGVTVRVISVTVSLLLASSCGLPGRGSPTVVEDDTVPYGLLGEAGSPDSSATPVGGLAAAPVVLWLSGDRLLPEATGLSCDEPAESLVRELLEVLVDGPSEEARASGRSSPLSAGSVLELVGVRGGTVEVALDPGPSLGAEQLPLAVGQIVLTLTSAPTIDDVELVTDGQPLQVPLPDGALTDGPVSALDYLELLPQRFTGSGLLGCQPA